VELVGLVGRGRESAIERAQVAGITRREGRSDVLLLERREISR